MEIVFNTIQDELLVLLGALISAVLFSIERKQRKEQVREMTQKNYRGFLSHTREKFLDVEEKFYELKKELEETMEKVDNLNKK